MSLAKRTTAMVEPSSTAGQPLRPVLNNMRHERHLGRPVGDVALRPELEWFFPNPRVPAQPDPTEQYVATLRYEVAPHDCVLDRRKVLRGAI